MHVTVCSVGRNVALLLTDGAQSFSFSCTYDVFDQLYKQDNRPLIGFPIVI